MNLRSGGGKAERFDLVDECRQRGIEPIVLEPGNDLLELAQDAIARGADVIGMAGGDGSQALVASVAMGADVPLVCVPAGTRNHFALDLGLDRDDVVGALDAFGRRPSSAGSTSPRSAVGCSSTTSRSASTRRSCSPRSTATRSGRPTLDLLPEMLGPDAEPFDLRFSGPDGTERAGAQIIQVSNNPYVLTRLGGFGTRARLDTGMLGVAAAEVRGAADVAALVAAETVGQVERFRGWTEWTTPTFTVDVGLDGGGRRRRRGAAARPAARVHVPARRPAGPPAPPRARLLAGRASSSPSAWWTVTALLRTAAGHPAPIDETMR